MEAEHLGYAVLSRVHFRKARVDRWSMLSTHHELDIARFHYERNIALGTKADNLRLVKLVAVDPQP